MGIIKDVLSKLGIRKSEETYLLDDKKLSSIIENMNSQQDEFNKYVEVQPSQSAQQVFSTPLDAEEKIIEEEKGRIKVFSHKDQSLDKIVYEIELETPDGKVIQIATVKELPSKRNLENILRQTSAIISGIEGVYENGGKNDRIQSELVEKMQTLSAIYNIDFSGKMMHMVETMGSTYKPDSFVDYKGIEMSLHKTIDVSRLKPEQILQYGRQLNERLTFLDSILTPDDAYRNKESLENFMRHEEKTKILSAIVFANLENLNSSERTLDFDTIIAFAKKMQTFSNEDGMLYSCYLKLEENRIIRKLQQDIFAYKEGLEDVPENISTKDLAEGFIDYLEASKIGTEVGNKDNIASYMIDTLQGRGIENYLKNTAKQDMKLRKFLTNNLVEDTHESSRYIEAKLACLGQVVDISEREQYLGEIPLLREVVEETEYKDSDVTEVKEFLCKVVQIEKDYIKKNYEPVLREFQKIVEQKDMKKQGEIR